MNKTKSNETKVTSSKAPKEKKSKAKFVIIPLVIALVICILIIIALVVLGSLGLLGVGVAGFFAFNKTNTPETTNVAVVETTEATTEEPTTQIITTTEPTIPQTTYNYEPDPYYGANTFYITYDTPAHAGVNLRETPEDNSAKIMVLPEGTTITRLYGDGETAQTKYILVCVEINGTKYTGYVMQRYVSTFSGASFDSYVSYNTPGHAGLVLRETSSGTSNKIMVVPEGTELRVTDNTTGAYWAVDVFYEGELYSGYVLSTYIESIY